MIGSSDPTAEEKREDHGLPPQPMPTYPTLFERSLPVGPRYAKFVWLGVFVLSALTARYIATGLPGQQANDYVRLSVLLSAGFLTVPSCLAFGYWMLCRWAGHLDEFVTRPGGKLNVWFGEQLSLVQGNVAMVILSSAFALLVVFAYWHGGYISYYSSVLAVSYLSALVLFSAFFGGLGLCLMVAATHVFWRLGSLPNIEVRLQRHKFGILSTGTTLFRCWFVAALVWAVYAATVVVGLPEASPRELLTKFPALLICLPTLPVIVGSFVVSLYPLHRKMLESKQRELRRIEGFFDTAKPSTLEEIDEELRKKIEFLERQRETLRRLPEWPFSLRSLVGTGFSTITALFPLLLDGAQLVTEWVTEWVTSNGPQVPG